MSEAWNGFGTCHTCGRDADERHEHGAWAPPPEWSGKWHHMNCTVSYVELTVNRVVMALAGIAIGLVLAGVAHG